MPTRSGDGFSFPIRKFDDGAGLYTNFKYLEQWLKGLGQGGASYAYVTIDPAGQDDWVAGYVEWERDAPAVVVDPDGIIASISGTNGVEIRVVPGIYVVTFVINFNGGVNTSTFEHANYYSAINAHITNEFGTFVDQQAQRSHHLMVSPENTTIDFQESITQTFVVDEGHHFRGESSPWSSGFSNNWEANTNFWFLEPDDQPHATFGGTHITFLKVA